MKGVYDDLMATARGAGPNWLSLLQRYQGLLGLVLLVLVAARNPEGQMPAEKRIVLPTERVDKDNADAYLAANPKLHK